MVGGARLSSDDQIAELQGAFTNVMRTMGLDLLSLGCFFIRNDEAKELVAKTRPEHLVYPPPSAVPNIHDRRQVLRPICTNHTLLQK